MRRTATQIDAIRAYSCSDVANLLGINRGTVHRWIVSGRLKAFDIAPPGSRPRLRVTESDLQAFIEDRRYTGGSVA